MKKTLILFLLFICLATFSFAVTSGTWALTTNGSCVVVGSVTGSAMVAGSGITEVNYGGEGVAAKGWNSASRDLNDFYQFTVTATAHISINSISVYTMRGGTSGTAAIYYSVNGGTEVLLESNFAIPATLTQHNITGLSISVPSGQTFRVHVYAWGLSSSDEVFRNKTFVITGQAYSVIESPTSASITSTSALLGGNITNIYGSNVTERGIYYSTTNGFADGSGTKVSETGSFGTGTFTRSVTGLSTSTLYYFKAFATNGGGTSYTSQASFTTLTPTINVTGTLADFGSVKVGSNSTEKTYSVSATNLIADLIVTAPTGYQVSLTSGSGFGASVSKTPTDGAVSSTTIHVRFTPSSSGVISGNITNASTSAVTQNVAVTGTGINNPVITSPTSSDITSSSAVLGGNITNINSSSVTERGIYYSITDDFADGTGTKVSETGTYGTGVFTLYVDGLTHEVTYYYKAFATNAAGTSYTEQASFTAHFASVASDYFHTKAAGNWDTVSIWESSHNGTVWYDATLKPTAYATMVTLNHGVTLTQDEACGALTFSTGGSVTFGNFNLNIGGTITGTAVFYYNGTGEPSQETTTSNTDVEVTNPTSIPEILNLLEIDSGAGTVICPNDVTFNSIVFTSGALQFDGHTLTAAGKNIALSSSNSVLSALSVDFSASSNYWDGSNSSIAATWKTSGAHTNTLDLKLTYPESETSANLVKVWKRNYGDTGAWTLVGSFVPVDNGSTRTVTVTGVSTLNSASKGDLNWTISDEGQTLPVELSSFTAIATPQNFVQLDWTTQSETNVSGYYIFRNTSNDLGTAERLNAFIPATNTSQETEYSFTDREATTGVTWYYWLQHIEMSGEYEFHGPINVTLLNNTDTNPIIPLVTSLQQIYPNPFNPRTTITFGLAKASNLNLVIYNSKGQIVRTLFAGYKSAGNYRIGWEGINDNGKALPSGIYYVKMTAGKQLFIQKVVLLK